MNIKIIDYNLGNISSIKNILKKIGYNKIHITNLSAEIADADFIILPGVGNFDTGIRQLKETDCFQLLNTLVLEDKIPILGICLGMQLLGLKSEEGLESGLKWLDFSCKKFDSTSYRKVPHMGWNYTEIVNNEIKLSENSRYYFVHSYYCSPENTDLIWMKTDYEGIEFASAVKKNNIMGVQFHPEKSHHYGMQLLKNILSSYE